LKQENASQLRGASKRTPLLGRSVAETATPVGATDAATSAVVSQAQGDEIELVSLL
jgi:hypothetical protein